MAKSTTVITQSRKKPGPSPTGKGTLVGVRLQPELLDAVDKFAAEQGAPSRPEAIRTLVEDRLVGLGFRKAGD